MGAPYRRGYKHTGAKGKEHVINCSFCGRKVPRWKTFVTYRGFKITDPVLRKQMDPRQMSFFQRKFYACPSCARFRGIVQIGRSRKTRVAYGEQK
ncbi:MAG: hypothetical protein V1802_01745 [Candidatus Aenigmatarchaeota archaeon]